MIKMQIQLIKELIKNNHSTDGLTSKLKANKKAVSFGLKAGVIASLCCIIPLTLIILGLASVSFALKFVQYKLYFILLSIIFLACSLWYFLKKQKCCVPGEKLNRKWFIGTALGVHLLTFLILLYILMPTVSPFLYHLSFEKTKPSALNNFSSLHQLTLKISGMTCSSCATGIQYELESLRGIIKAEVSFYSSQAIVAYDPNKIDQKEILESKIFLNSSPYHAKIIEDKILE
jgi:copper chaperone CopZ